MGLHYRSGFGRIFDKEAEQTVAEIKYQLIETDPTKYTNKKWWGEFSTDERIKRMGKYVIEFEDSRAGECFISVNQEKGEVRLAALHHYRFFGRGKLGRFSLGGHQI
ncbi:MAG: hypothetical protein PHU08_06490 [Dehalococcoidales bacterium]|nr:hypothetical protein [Dehalococcoidales bacterium]